MKEKQAITKEVAKRYRKAQKKEKTKMLDELVATTEYNRSYATRALRLALKQSQKADVNQSGVETGTGPTTTTS